jgi:CheY-like chemotaxis protein
MDIQMPKLDGVQAITRLRADPQLAATPILAVTALALPGDRERCLQAGADDYVAKPFLLKDLTTAITARLQDAAFSPT